MADVETDVLIVGSGPAGGAAALLLSTYGVPNIVVTKYGRLSDTPRAHITNQRTMEVLRDAGIEDQVIAQATPQRLMGDTVFCSSLAGEELGRLHTWYTHPARQADHDLASPSSICDMPQHLMEPVLVGTAVARGTSLRYQTEYLSLEQDADGVTATVRDRLRGDEYRIRAKYLIGADGGRSKVAADIGLPMVGQMGVAGSINIVFEADLTALTAHRPSTLYWVLQTGSDVGGIGMGLVRCVRPWHEWLIVWGYDINGAPPDLTEDYARRIAHHLIGDDSVPVTIKSSSAWTVNHLYAETYQNGRVFCMGDAVHRHPPSNGLGSNTSIQDAYNLAWKLRLVLNGTAGPALLDTYSAERAPVGRQIVDRANRSIGETTRIFDALGLLTTGDPEQLRRNMDARKLATPAAEKQRRELREAIEFKNYEFNTHGVELDQRYTSSAVLPDGPPPANPRDAELYHHPTTWPGAKVPHAWVVRGNTRLSTLDLGGGGRFVLLTGPGGEPWVTAAAALGVTAHVIGPGADYEDAYGDWARLREVGDSGCVLLRPDNYVGYRASELAADPAGELSSALNRILGR
ncbi:2,4-dichlorophenol 6-monooxygenase [Paractinoplanes abujensis]|uniref:2,4-dichlorophenol 6-monooxygenase n=1 Tax=Paractinoplanes abujensis TaxID=882441 RepID=A0A7W7G6B9_9ACTN|nr:FAD-dependent monooxygenase [Actinoplanes abujensis]MBB4697270.1 2,4-dichlorophenol 6-monooxygenase [Actinoplanes abujensis]GID18254.1 2,4-dichlorophenol 6-monooxygenase [Actinoplanes abujensis]